MAVAAAFGRATGFLLLLALIAPSALAAQRASLNGVVSVAGASTPIPGAIVSVDGIEQRTDRLGLFRFDGLSTGRHVLAVRALGYLPVSRTISLRADSTLRVSLTPRPVVLDTMMVRGRTATVKITAVDARSGNSILRASATTYPGSQTVGGLNGHFTFPDIPVGSTLQVSLEALEYLPVFLEIVPARDTSIKVSMRVDSVGIRMILVQVKRLERRAKGIPLSVDDLDRREIRESGVISVGEVILRRLPSPKSGPRKLPTECVFLNDREIDSGLLMGLVPEEVERVEIFARGRMIRVYTTSYVSGLGGVETLPRPLHMGIGLGTVCN